MDRTQRCCVVPPAPAACEPVAGRCAQAPGPGVLLFAMWRAENAVSASKRHRANLLALSSPAFATLRDRVLAPWAVRVDDNTPEAEKLKDLDIVDTRGWDLGIPFYGI